MPIDSHLSYLDKNTFVPIGSEGYDIDTPPHEDLGMVVVIPCHDEPDLIGSLQALLDCEPADCAVEFITVINSGVHHSEEIRAQNAATLREAREWAHTHARKHLQFHFLYFPDLPRKHAGVGLARKIGMDMAAHRLELAKQPLAPIVCFDADSRCSPNYLREIERHFQERKSAGFCSIHFEHPLEGQHPPEVYKGILRYELYLRYYVNGLKYAGSPYGHHTIGSSMAVRSWLYQAQGGMNRRKAGEDFYFLNKLPRAEKSVLHSAMVIPSPRPSERVPFGTGKAIGAWLEAPDEDYPVYAPESFGMWKEVTSRVQEWYSMDKVALKAAQQGFSPPVCEYMSQINFVEQVIECQQNTTDIHTFHQRYDRWLNGLRTLQFFHFVRDHHLPNLPLQEAANTLRKMLTPDLPEETGPIDLKALLIFFRELDRCNDYIV